MRETKSAKRKAKSVKPETQKVKFIAVFLGLFLLLPAISFAVQPLPKQTEGIAPAFSLADLNGNKVSLADLRGKPLILFFWATWCPYCRREIPFLVSKYKEIKSQGLGLLAVDIGEQKDKVSKFIAKNNVEFPVLLDKDSSVSGAYGVIGIPTFILIDSEGKIKFQGNDLPDNYVQILSPK